MTRAVFPARAARPTPPSAVESLETRTLLSVAGATPGSAALAAGDATVVARHVFYNRSAFDGRGARADDRDDGAVAPDKFPLLPGQAITPASYTSYTRGINGVMVDVAGLPPDAPIGSDDFDFRVGNNGQPSSWKPAPAPRSVRVASAPDASGVARVTITWRDRAIRNTWLRVTVNAGAGTGLAAPDVFYVGNLIGDAGDDAARAVARVGDEDGAGAGTGGPRLAGIDDPADVDRNGRVTRADAKAARRNRGAELYAAGPFATPGAAAMDAALPGQWRLVFRDEFAGAALDPVWHPAQYWDHDLTVVGDGELQAYEPAGLSVSDGMLHLTAREDDRHGVPYTSGLVMTGGEKSLPASPRFSFLYGYLEVRAKIPAGAGLWPAVWMMPASYHDDAGELDVVEILGGEPTQATFTTHRGRRQDGHDWDGPDLSDDFHTYAVEWQPEYIAWFVDGVERARSTGAQWVVHEAMYPILNLAVGGRHGPPPDDSTPFPATMEVDYIRVWQSE